MMNLPGKATHFKCGARIACGRVGVAYSTDVIANVDCRQCRTALKRAAGSTSGGMTRRSKSCATDVPKTPAERKAAERQRRRDAGLAVVQAWVYPDDREKLARYVEKLNARHNRDPR